MEAQVILGAEIYYENHFLGSDEATTPSKCAHEVCLLATQILIQIACAP